MRSDVIVFPSVEIAPPTDHRADEDSNQRSLQSMLGHACVYLIFATSCAKESREAATGDDDQNGPEHATHEDSFSEVT